MRKNKIKFKKYDELLQEQLKDPREAAAYLNAHLEKEEDESEAEHEQLFLLALRHVAKAHRFSDIASKSNLGRESLYKALSGTGNPKLETLRALLKAIGLKLAVLPIDENVA